MAHLCGRRGHLTGGGATFRQGTPAGRIHPRRPSGRKNYHPSGGKGTAQEATAVGAQLLCSPLVQLYLLALGSAFILALWPRESGPQAGATGSRGLARGDCRRPPAGDGPALAARRLSKVNRGSGLFPLRELEASCSAVYAIRFALAIHRTRID